MKSQPVASIALAAAAFAPSLGWAASLASSPKIQTTSGLVVGHAADGAPQVSEFLGIPYAQPPVGDLRFQPPVKHRGSSVVEAKSFGYACPQVGSAPITDEAKSVLGMTESGDVVQRLIGFWPGDVGPMSEDCLTLNVWTKRKKGAGLKPVLFWIHGGGYSSGSAVLPVYNGKLVADQEDVIVVSANYRLNVLGFPGNPLAPGNLGLRDIRLAVEWVRDNIEAFGGDKTRITIFGQSAGGGLVDYYAFAYAADPIANGFVLMSGVAQGSQAPVAPDAAAKSWLAIAGAVGCPNDTATEQTYECMRRVPSETLVAPLYSANESLTGSSAVSGFVAVADDELIWADYSNRSSAAGGYIVGVADFEAGLFRPYAPHLPDAVWVAAQDAIFDCPAAKRSQQAKDAGHPVWRYRSFQDFPNLAITTTPPSGAWHGSELPVFFGTSPQEAIADTAEQLAYGKYIRGALAAFASDTANGLLSYDGGWPKYDAWKKTLVRLGYENKTGTNLALGNAYDLSCIL